MDRKQRGIAPQVYWFLFQILLLGEQANADDVVPDELEFLEWVGETIDAREIGVDMDALLVEYERQLNQGNDVNLGKEIGQ